MYEIVLTKGRTRPVYNSFENADDMWEWYCSQIGPKEIKEVMKQISNFNDDIEKGRKNENIQNRKRKPKAPVLDPPKKKRK